MKYYSIKVMNSGEIIGKFYDLEQALSYALYLSYNENKRYKWVGTETDDIAHYACIERL